VKKGIVLTIDATVAATVMLALIISSTYYIQSALTSRWEDVNLVRTAYDIGLTLDEAGILASDDDALIDATLAEVKQNNVNVSMNREMYHYIGGGNQNLSFIKTEHFGDSVDEDFATVAVVSQDDLGSYYLTRIKVSHKK